MTKQSRTKIPALDDNGKFVYKDKQTRDIQTYDISCAVSAYKEGYEVYALSPSNAVRLFSIEEIEDAYEKQATAKDNLFLIREVEIK
tara:strand:- start:4283 stop:4543 length:261 start_codon:yes stop_codon:yes gene_type:complete